jgi:thioredoxin-related protein
MISMKGLTASIALVAGILLPSLVAQAKIPEGWPFVDFNEAVELSKRQGKPMFVYFGFAACPYCIYLNEHTFTDEALRKRYTANYVLAYFDIRGNPNETITLPDGDTITRAEAIKRLKGSPVPAWMFVSSEGKQILTGRGSRTRPDVFMTYDSYVAGGAYRRMTFEEFLAKRGLSVN